LIEAIRTAAKADELVEISVVVEIGPGIRLATSHAEELRLDELEPRRGRLRKKRNGEERREPQWFDGWHSEAEGNTRT
jgi:hypothetical protein